MFRSFGGPRLSTVMDWCVLKIDTSMEGWMDEPQRHRATASIYTHSSDTSAFIYQVSFLYQDTECISRRMISKC